MNIFGKKQDRNLLEMTPFTKHKHEVDDEGFVRVLIPRFKSKFANKYLLPKKKSTFIKANLDEFGSSTWLLMDGTKTVKDIGESLEEEYGEEIQPVNDRLTEFVNQLYANGFISFNELIKGK